MSDERKACPHDCTQCTTVQHILCSAQFTHDCLMVVNSMKEELAALKNEIAELKEAQRKELPCKVDINSTVGSGAENRLSEQEPSNSIEQ